MPLVPWPEPPPACCCCCSGGGRRLCAQPAAAAAQAPVAGCAAYASGPAGRPLSSCTQSTRLPVRSSFRRSCRARLRTSSASCRQQAARIKGDSTPHQTVIRRSCSTTCQSGISQLDCFSSQISLCPLLPSNIATSIYPPFHHYRILSHSRFATMLPPSAAPTAFRGIFLPAAAPSLCARGPAPAARRP